MSDLKKVMMEGGIVKVKGVTVFFDCPDNLNYFTKPTGFHLRCALGWLVYFKCRERSKAQEVADEIFGKGAYKVQAKI